MKTWMLALLVSTTLISVDRAATGAVRPTDLRCEYLRNPLGIDALQPRLSWILQPTNRSARGLRQTAYQIVAADSRKALSANTGNLWDSGKVESDRSILVPYAGKTLAAGERCFWKVRVWDQQGNSSAWSRPAFWTIGLLRPEDWSKAEWIGLPGAGGKQAVLREASWIWLPEGNPASSAPVGRRYFRRTVTVPDGRPVRTAHLLMTADNEFVAFINGQRVGAGNNFKSVSDFDVTTQLHAGENVIAVEATNAGDSPNPAGLIGELRIEFAAGEPLVVGTGADWKSADRANAGWQRVGVDASGWAAAKVLGNNGMAPWGTLRAPDDRRLPARYLRHEFALDRKVARATAYVCGLGLFEFHLNGHKIGDHVLEPAVSEYDKRQYYVTFDVTSRLKPGANAIGVILGNGRYYAPRATEPTTTRSFGYPTLLFKLHVEFRDGTATDIVSDTTWKLTANGPIRANNEYDGEEYDARMELPGWDRPGYDDSAWQAAQVVYPDEDDLRIPDLGDRPLLGPLFLDQHLHAQMIEPIRVTRILHPKTVKELRSGVYIYDMGQNMVGWCRLTVRGPGGTRVTLRHAERLKSDGSLYVANLRSAKATDEYILKGKGTEVYEPRFTYHGFRYVELSGYPGTPALSTLEGCVVHDDLASAGRWASSNPLLNRIYRNVLWGVRGNYRSMPTDCPQRDERQGWLGDRSEESLGETYLFNTAALYRKWLQDMADSQRPSGSVPDVCPAYWPIYSDNVTWPATSVIVPDHLFEQYGDSEIIARHYACAKQWIDYMTRFLKDDLMSRDSYGDWCVPPEDPKLIHSRDPKMKTSATVLGTTYFYHCLELMAAYATRLGKTDDAAHYRELAGKLKEAFNAKLLKADGSQYDNGTQTSCILPLAFGLVPTADRQRIFDHLVDKITHESRDHIGTGLVGGQWLMRTLSDNGRADLAYTLATQRTYPSWGYMISKGATTIWELWNGDTANPAMNSGNHVMLVGDLVTWLYEDLAGIKPDPAHPGFRHIIMRPRPVGDLRFVRATHRSPYGLIVSDWKLAGGAFDWQVQVPVNTTATIYVPAKNEGSVTEGGRPASRAPGVKLLRFENGRAIYELGSGRYGFASR
jgi:alpha-L-rhamnosidase